MAEIRFCTAPDGARLAYAMHGRGPPLVRVATWLTHLELDWESPVWRHWLDRLGESHTVVRYDERGCGLSDAGVGELSVETWVGDLEAVVDAAGMERSRCSAYRRARRSRWRTPRGTRSGSPISSSTAAMRGPAAAWAARAGRGADRGHPRRVGERRAAFRHVFSMLFLPHGTPEQMAWYDELLRTTTSAGAAVGCSGARRGRRRRDAAPRVERPDAGHPRAG